MSEKMYLTDEYLKKNPSYDVEHSSWKARQIAKILKRNRITANSICEVGCGAGQILVELQKFFDFKPDFVGYEISSSAYRICKEKKNKRLHFKLGDILKDKKAFFDLILIIDVIEHVENYFYFLRKLKLKSRYKVFHIPLDISVQKIFRPKHILSERERVGHINYFTKEIALQSLKDCGYEVIDYFYTPWGIELPSLSFMHFLFRIPMKLLFLINKDLAVRIFGGHSLLVLTK